MHEELRLFVAQVIRDHDDEDEDEAPRKPEILALINPEITPASRQSRRTGKAA